jgi:RNA polymerase sigma factor (sigma-70 family)
MSNRPFDQIVREHGVTVLRVCRAVVGPVDAEDAWSETFLSALRAYPDLDPNANVEAWLVTIAHRKAIDLVRARARGPVPVAELPERRPGTGGGTDRGQGAGALENAERDRDLFDALRSLPAKQRQAVAYHHLAGLPHKEVARILGGTVEAARRAASDGIRALRAVYAKPPPTQGERR